MPEIRSFASCSEPIDQLVEEAARRLAGSPRSLALTEALAIALVTEPSRRVDLDLYDRTEIKRGRLACAAEAGYHFAMRCLEIVADSPVRDSTHDLRALAVESRRRLIAELSSEQPIAKNVEYCGPERRATDAPRRADTSQPASCAWSSIHRPVVTFEIDTFAQAHVLAYYFDRILEGLDGPDVGYDRLLPLTESVIMMLMRPFVVEDVDVDVYDRSELRKQSLQTAVFAGFDFALRVVHAAVSSPASEVLDEICAIARATGEMLIDGLSSRSVRRIFNDLGESSRPATDDSARRESDL